MIRVAAVDDEAHALERFERMIKEFKDIELCGLFETGEQLLAYLRIHPLDAVFLDIEMPEVNGLELSAQIMDLHEDMNIVFVTAFNQYAVEAFELQAMDYILKPLTEERLGKTIKRLSNKKATIKQHAKVFIQCMGSFEVFLDGQALTWKNSKAKEILAFLVQMGGIAVSWEKIADAVWPEYNAEKAQTNFHATMYLLRKRLAEAGISQMIESGRGNYRVVIEEVDCDLYQFEALVRSKPMKDKDVHGVCKQLEQRGYMEDCGYSWAQPRAAELEEACSKIVCEMKQNK